MNNVKDRIDKVDDRIKVLIKKYPIVFSVVIFIGIAIGMIIGSLVF